MSNNIDPSKWGSPAWKFLHYVTLGCPSDAEEYNLEKYKDFFKSLQYVLPCKTCRENYKNDLHDYPLDMITSKESLITWLIQMHSSANYKHNKKVYTCYDFEKEYDYKPIKCPKYNMYGGGGCNINNIIYIIILLFSIIITLFIIYKFIYLIKY